MKRSSLLLAALLGLVLVTGLAVAASSRRVHDGPVYTMADVRDELGRTPRAWVGRTVVVRALAQPCPWNGGMARYLLCAGQPLVLAGAPAEAPAAPLPIVRVAAHPLLSFARKLPILGYLLPRPRMVPLFALAHFRVRLLALPTGACAGRLPCYAAQWLDSVPGSL